MTDGCLKFRQRIWQNSSRDLLQRGSENPSFPSILVSMTPTRSVLVLAALEQEEQALIGRLKEKLGNSALRKTVLSRKLGLEMTSADLNDRSISILRTGIGSVNAALALLLAHESEKKRPFDSIILLGVGGAVREGLDVGDLVISTRVLQHDYFYSFDHGDQRIRPGALILSSKEAENHDAEIPADPGLIEWLKKSELAADFKAKVFTGTILSGSEFVGRVERKRAIASLLPDALLVDMEAAGVAQLAHRLEIPFVIAKTVADRLNPDGSIESDFRKCLDAASAHAAAALNSLL